MEIVLIRLIVDLIIGHGSVGGFFLRCCALTGVFCLACVKCSFCSFRLFCHVPIMQVISVIVMYVALISV